MRSLLAVIVLSVVCGCSTLPQTRAERTGYRETTRYAEVMDFLRQVTAYSSSLHLTEFGFSQEGRSLPLVISGETTDPIAIRTSAKLRVYVQGNIHAGEVCGKEALLAFLRELAQGQHKHLMDHMVLLVAPIYNPDGNEKIALTHRPRQHGPIGGMGTRTNAQGLDLNRDHIKLASPEARSLVALLQDYDPHVVIDLHTTNGTYHGYDLTYSPPLHPNTDPRIVELLRERWLPEVTTTLRKKFREELYYYGNVPSPTSEQTRGWYTFDHRPRFNNNYLGLRNRFGILSEAYSYATFEERVRSSHQFVVELISWAAENSETIRATTRSADEQSLRGTTLALSAEHAPSEEPATILLGEVKEERHPYSGELILRRTEARRSETMPHFGEFRPSRTESVPLAYLIPANETKVLDNLRAHGLQFHTSTSAVSVPVQRYVITSHTQAEQEFQGHRQSQLGGRYESYETQVPAGTVVVSTDQPLGRLLFTLLEPGSDDGLTNWNYLDGSIEVGHAYPILRTNDPAVLGEHPTSAR